MFRIGKTISGILLEVFFVALAAIATTFYEADKDEQAEIKNMSLLKKGGETIDFISNFASSWAAQRTKSEVTGKANQFLNNIQEIASSTDKFLPAEAKDQPDAPPVTLEAVSETAVPALGDLMGEGRDLLTEGKDILKNETSADLKERWSDAKFWEYRKNESGAEIILSSKNGQEYIIPLPFKLLSEKQ